jgi:hypothetical protein
VILEETKRRLEERLQFLFPGHDWPGKDGHWSLLQLSTMSWVQDVPPEMGFRGMRPLAYDDERGKLIIDMARDGDADADTALCQLAAAFIDGGLPVPPNLRSYISDRLRSSGEGTCARSNRRGPKMHTNFRRNYAIVCAVAELVSRGFDVTRNEATEGESACSIVTSALKRLHTPISLSESAVAKIYASHVTLVMRLEPIRTAYAALKVMHSVGRNLELISNTTS